MNKAVILPTPGDPFLLNYWMKLFDDVWGSEIDTLYVHINSPAPKEVIDYLHKRFDRPNIHVKYTPAMIDHGEAIKTILPEVTEEYIMLVEDDGFIFKPGIVAWAFEQLEQNRYDIVGSKRGSCGFEIIDKASEKWGIPMDGEGDQGPNFWPCYFFTTTAILRSIDNYSARMWKSGELVEPLDLIVKHDQAGDTFVEASLQLRNKIPAGRIIHLPQYHVHPDDEEHYKQNKSIWDGKARWLHVGSLSSGAFNLLDANRPLPQAPSNSFEKREYERRVQWWQTFYDNREPGSIEAYAKEYQTGIERLTTEFRLNRKNIQRRRRIYKEAGIYDL